MKKDGRQAGGEEELIIPTSYRNVSHILTHRQHNFEGNCSITVSKSFVFAHTRTLTVLITKWTRSRSFLTHEGERKKR